MNLEDRFKEYNDILDGIIEGVGDLEPAMKEEKETQAAILDAAEWFKEIGQEDGVTEDFLAMLVWAFKLGAAHNAVNVAAHATIIITDLGDTKFSDLVKEEDDEPVH